MEDNVCVKCGQPTYEDQPLCDECIGKGYGYCPN